MRIHTSATREQIVAAVKASGATIASLSEHGSRKRDHAFELKLHGNSPFKTQANDGHAASWDQWGIAIEGIFKADNEAIVGIYPTWSAFQYATYNRFDTLTADQAERRHRWEPRGDYTAECGKCAAEQRWDWQYKAVVAV